MKKSILALATIALFALWGCNSGDSPSESASSNESGDSGGGSDGAALAREAVDTYTEAMTKAMEMLEGQPPADDIKEELQALYDETSAKLIEIGGKIDALDEAARKAFDKAYDKENYDKNIALSMPANFSDLSRPYEDADYEFSKFLYEFGLMNKLGDYNYLRQYLPEKATELGIQ